MSKENKTTARQNMASEGVLNEQYTLNSWFVKVKIAFGIVISPLSSRQVKNLK